jgi:hypothetical protein
MKNGKHVQKLNPTKELVIIAETIQGSIIFITKIKIF